MSYIAIFHSYLTGEEMPVCTRDVDSNTPLCGYFLCASCRAPVRLRDGFTRTRHFWGNHFSGCDIRSLRSRHTILLPTGFSAPLEHIISAKDPPIQELPPDKTFSPPPMLQAAVDDDRLPTILQGPKALRNASALYHHLWKLPSDTPISINGSLTVGDLLIREETFAACRKAGFDNEIRLTKVRRVNPSTLAPALKKTGYLVFRDVYSRSEADAIFYLVKLRERTQHKHFYELVAGSDGVRSKHKHLVLLGKWHRIPIPSVRAYYAEINSRCYYFIDEKVSK